MRLVLGLSLLLASPALAQQQIDPAVWQQIAVHLQQQRDAAMLAAAKAEVELAKLKAELAAKEQKESK